MCGIVGYIGEKDAVPLLVDGLRRLEYRGYDSAGISVIQDGRLQVRRAAGKIANLETVLRRDPLEGKAGVAHTRWATHGKPCDANAHPHTDCSGSLAVVHNGIIENHLPLRAALEAEGHRFRSETDTEVIAHLIERSPEGELEAATQRAVTELRGAYALGIISQRDPGKVVAVRSGGPPLVVGAGENGLILASDIAALLSHTRDVLILEDGEMAVLSGTGAKITALDGSPVRRRSLRVPWDASAAEKNGFPHFMLKEIYEQPRALADTLRERIDLEHGEVVLPETGLDRAGHARLRRLLLLACGTSWHAALVGKYLLEGLGNIPVEVDIGSEFRYRHPIANERTLTIAITQSGETADTLGALREARKRGSRTLAICNVVGSTASREAQGTLYTRAGPEIGVASTKSFTCQLAALLLLAIDMGRARGELSAARAGRLLSHLAGIPRLVETELDREGEAAELARKFFGFRSFLYLGRGIHYPLALEGALKLKELSYIHAEGYAAGEMKHGPIALIDRMMPVVVLAPMGRLYEKVLANIQEIKARDGIVIVLASEGDGRIAAVADHVLKVPRTLEILLPILLAIPLQLLAYHVAVQRHCDVDQPRNLAKSVTVE